MSGFESSLSYRLTCGSLLLWWVCSFYPLLAVTDIDEGDAALATSQGNLTNQLLVIWFALLGLFYFRGAIRNLRGRRDLRATFVLLGAYLLWSGASILWSDNVALSIRRLGQFILVLIGAIGLGAGFYAQTRERTLTVSRHVCYCGWTAVVLLIGSRFGDLSGILNPAWTLKDNTAAQNYIYPVAFGIIATQVLLRGKPRKQLAAMSLLLLVLLILKGRTMIVGLVAVMFLISVPFTKRTLLRACSLLTGIFFSLTQLDLATGGRMFIASTTWIAESAASVLPYLTVGNGLDDLLSLDGRLPLWQTLWIFVKDHPLIGHGFGAFWNPMRFDDIYHDVGWHAVAAHNGFLDELLGTGAIGLILCLAFWFSGLRAAVQLSKRDKTTGYLLAGWLLLFLSFNSAGSLLQSYFQSPTLFCLTALFSIPGPSQQHETLALDCFLGHEERVWTNKCLYGCD